MLNATFSSETLCILQPYVSAMLKEQEANTILMSKIFLDFSYFLKMYRNISKTLSRPDASEGTC